MNGDIPIRIGNLKGPQGDPGPPGDGEGGGSGIAGATAPATYDPATQKVGVAVGTVAGTVAAGNDTRIVGAAQRTDLGSAAGQPASAFDPAGAASGAVTAHTGATDPHGDRAFTTARISALVNGAPGLLDTLGELAAQLAADESAAAALTAAINARLVAASNLADVADPGAARGNLGLGSAATQPTAAFDASGAAAAAVTAHTAAVDPHGDRAFTTAQVSAAVNALIASAPGTLDTLGEIAAQLATDESAVGALTAAVNARLVAANNLSDLSNKATARTNLQLGTAATVDTGTAAGNIPVLGAGGRLAIARVASGTPDGTKFVRDDGTLAAPGASGGVTQATVDAVAGRRAYAPWLPRIGDYVTWPATNNGQATFPADGSVNLFPYFLPPGTYDAIAFTIQAVGSAGSVIVGAAWADTGIAGAEVGALLAQTGQLDSTTTGTKVGLLTVPIVAPAGGLTVWAGLIVQGGATTKPNAQGYSGLVLPAAHVMWGGYTDNYYVTNAGLPVTGLTSATLPAAAPTLSGRSAFTTPTFKLGFRRSA